MELITNIIIEYLKHNKRLVVPKLGAFIVKQPGGKILFSELMRGEDTTLRSLLVAYGMGDIEANGLIDRFVFEIRHAVGKGDSYTIEGFGRFSAGDNNNILFKQLREPITIGGNINPPIESLNEAKRMMRRASSGGSDAPSVPKSEIRPSNTAPQRRQRPAGDGGDDLSITKPDSYLRGLRYENKKSKGHDADHRGSRDRRGVGRNMRVLIWCALLLAAVIFIIWYFWFGDSHGESSSGSAVVEHVEHVERVEPDTLTMTTDSMTMQRGAVDGDNPEEHIKIESLAE